MPVSLSSSKHSCNSYSSSNCPAEPPGGRSASADCPSGAQGPDLYIMDPANRNFSSDTLHISLDISFENSDLISRLAEAKKEIQLQDLDESPFNILQNGSRNFIWSLKRTGSGKYHYVLIKGDLRLLLSNRPAGSRIPNGRLEIGSISCNSDPSKIFKELKFWLSCENVTVLSDKVSRFDICSDFLQDIRSTHCDKIDRYVTRARDFDPKYSDRKLTGVVIGSGDIQCRIYDKQAEMRKKGDLEKQLFFWKKWGVTPSDPVTRVEFQVRGDSLNQFFNGEKPSLDEFLVTMKAVWQYLTVSWLRYTQFSVTRARESNNQDKAATSHFWKKVQSASGFVASVVRKAKESIVNVVRLIKQAGGCLTGVAAARGVDFRDKKGIVQTFKEVIDEWFNEKYTEPGFETLYISRQARAILF